MDKEMATMRFLEFVKPKYNDVVITSVTEKKDRFMFAFIEKNDDCPIDYPLVSVNKKTGVVGYLSFLSPKDRRIIYG